jgi:hypothetical protein
MPPPSEGRPSTLALLYNPRPLFTIRLKFLDSAAS